MIIASMNTSLISH